jgi:DNA-binding transcriptional MerR regulator
MSAAPAGGHAFLGIGEVLGQLRSEFPDVTISKIRFLETEGLVEPERTPSGYRKFTRSDVDRLRYVLTAQREHYLPLRVIKDHLGALDRGLQAPAGGGRPQIPGAAVIDTPGPEAFAPDLSEMRLSRAELLEASGLEAAALGELEQYGLVRPRPGAEHYDGDSLLIAKTLAELAAFGIGPRHLRAFKLAADREVGLVEQVVNPLVRQRNPDSRARAEVAARQLAALSVRLHAALVRAALRPLLSR